MMNEQRLDGLLKSCGFHERSAFHRALIAICDGPTWPSSNIAAPMDIFAKAMEKQLPGDKVRMSRTFSQIRSCVSKLNKRIRDEWRLEPRFTCPFYIVTFLASETRQTCVFTVFDPSLAPLLLAIERETGIGGENLNAQARRRMIRQLIEFYYDFPLPQLPQLGTTNSQGVTHIPFGSGAFKRRVPLDTLVQLITADRSAESVTERNRRHTQDALSSEDKDTENEQRDPTDIEGGGRRLVGTERADTDNVGPPPWMLGLWGLSGIGKTTLAREIETYDKVQTAFQYRVFSLILGKIASPERIERSVTKVDNWLLQTITKATKEIAVIENAKKESLWIRSKSYPFLLILDDVHSPAQVEAFRQLGEHCCILATSKSRRVLESIIGLPALILNLAPLNKDESSALFDECAGPIPRGVRDECKSLVEYCAGIPLALKIAGRMVSQYSHRVAKPTGGLKSGELNLFRAFVRDYTETDPYAEVGETIYANILGACIQTFLTTKEQIRLRKLAIAPAQTRIPCQALGTFWSLRSRDEIDNLVDTFVGQALIELEPKTGAIWLHDMVHGYLRQDEDEMRALHEELVRSYARVCSPKSPSRIDKREHIQWSSLPPDGYCFEHFPYHLVHAGWHEQLDRLLLDFGWLSAKLEKTDAHCLLDDFNLVPKWNEDIQAVGDAIRLSVHVLTRDKKQFASQLLGRLIALDSTRLQKLKRTVDKESTGPFVRAVNACLQQSGGRLECSIKTSSGRTTGAVFPPGGLYAISFGRRCITWLLSSGQRTANFAEEERDRILFAAPVSGSELLVTASRLGNVDLWNWREGEFIRRIATGETRVRGLLISPNGSKVVCVTESSLKIYDVVRKRKPMALPFSDDMLTGDVTCIALLRDERAIAIGMENGAVILLDSGSGTVEKTLHRHEEGVNVIIPMPDISHLISVSDDGSSVLWNRGTGRPVGTFGGSRPVKAAEVSADGRLLVTGDIDGFINVWNVENGLLADTFKAHSTWINSIAIIPEKESVLTCGGDNLIRVSRLKAAGHPLRPDNLRAPIIAVAFDSDGACGISMSEDGRIEVWSVDTGEKLAELDGASYLDMHGAISRNGRHVAYRKGSLKHDYVSVELWNTERPSMFYEYWLSAISHTAMAKNSTSQPSGRIGWVKTPLDRMEHKHSRGRHEPVSGAKWFNATPGTPETRELLAGVLKGTRSGYLDSRQTAQRAYMGSSMDGKTIAVSDNGMRIAFLDSGITRVWDLNNGIELHASRSGSSCGPIAISGSGKWVVNVNHDKNTIARRFRVLDIVEQQEHFTEIPHEDNVVDLAIDDRLETVVSVSEDGALEVWSVKDGQRVTSFTADGALKCCAISPESSTILAGDVFGQVYILRLASR